MKKMILGTGIILIFAVSVAIGIIIWPETTTSESISPTILNKTADISPTPYIHNTSTAPDLPTTEQMISPINWSSYSIFSYSGILKSKIEGPNEIINHSFLDVHIKVNILDSENIPEIYKQMSHLVKAERKIIGPNSSVEVWGYVPDGRIFKAGMLPFNSTIYRRDFVHPVHNLTFSNIDISEVN